MVIVPSVPAIIKSVIFYFILFFALIQWFYCCYRVECVEASLTVDRSFFNASYLTAPQSNEAHTFTMSEGFDELGNILGQR